LLQRGRVLGDAVAWFADREEARLSGVELRDGLLWVEVAGVTDTVRLALEAEELSELFNRCAEALVDVVQPAAAGPEEPPATPPEEVPQV